MTDIFDSLRARIAQITITKRIGRMPSWPAARCVFLGFLKALALGDRVMIHSAGRHNRRRGSAPFKGRNHGFAGWVGEGLAINDTGRNCRSRRNCARQQLDRTNHRPLRAAH